MIKILNQVQNFNGVSYCYPLQIIYNQTDNLESIQESNNVCKFYHQHKNKRKYPSGSFRINYQRMFNELKIRNYPVNDVLGPNVEINYGLYLNAFKNEVKLTFANFYYLNGYSKIESISKFNNSRAYIGKRDLKRSKLQF